MLVIVWVGGRADVGTRVRAQSCPTLCDPMDCSLQYLIEALREVYVMR